MAQGDLGLIGDEQRSNWIRLRTMILLRWFAVIGQLVAITLAQRLYNLQLELGLCYLAVGVSIVGNLIAISVFPENKRLSETENFMMVMFDLLQLCFLLYLTGGLHNPFSLLVLAPVTVSAAVLTNGPAVGLQFVSGTYVPIMVLPTWMLIVGSLFPVKWMAQGFRSVLLPPELVVFESAGSWEHGRIFLVLAAWSVGGLLGCRALFRWSDRS